VTRPRRHSHTLPPPPPQVHVVKKHPVKLSLNFLGLALLFLASGFAISKDAAETSAALLPSAGSMRAAREARAEFELAQARFHESRGWFWSCEGRCIPLRAEAARREAAHELLTREHAAAVSSSKAALGLFSSAGVGEARDLFWRTFAGAQSYAKRATMWDLFFVGMRTMGRDEPLAQFVISMLLRFLSNLTLGIFMGVVQFLGAVTTVISSYQPGWAGAILFFALCALAGLSFFVTACVTLTAAGVATVVGAGAVLTLGAGDAARRQRVHGD
jgi:hypothetical protein